MKILKYKDIKEGDEIDEKILENMVWCREFEFTTPVPVDHGYGLRIWYKEVKK